jgi:hypothetical protein
MPRTTAHNHGVRARGHVRFARLKTQRIGALLLALLTCLLSSTSTALATVDPTPVGTFPPCPAAVNGQPLEAPYSAARGEAITNDGGQTVTLGCAYAAVGNQSVIGIDAVYATPIATSAEIQAWSTADANGQAALYGCGANPNIPQAEFVSPDHWAFVWVVGYTAPPATTKSAALAFLDTVSKSFAKACPPVAAAAGNESAITPNELAIAAGIILLLLIAGTIAVRSVRSPKPAPPPPPKVRSGPDYVAVEVMNDLIINAITGEVPPGDHFLGPDPYHEPAPPSPVSPPSTASVPSDPPDAVTPAKIADLETQFEKTIDHGLAYGYYVRNPDLVHKAWSNTFGRVEEVIDNTTGGQCQECAAWGRSWISDYVRDKFGPGAIVDDLLVHTGLPGLGDYINHIATRVILPDGQRLMLDYWEQMGRSHGTVPAKLVPEDQWVEKWKGELPDGAIVSRTDIETTLHDLMTTLPTEQAAARFRQLYGVFPKSRLAVETLLKSWDSNPW